MGEEVVRSATNFQVIGCPNPSEIWQPAFSVCCPPSAEPCQQTCESCLENCCLALVIKEMKYNKLVRDKIPEYIKSKGGISVTHIADDEEDWEKLKEKLQEEIDEFMEKSNIEEVADISEIIDAICEYRGFNKEDLQKIKEKKAGDRGKFKDRIILEES